MKKQSILILIVVFCFALLSACVKQPQHNETDAASIPQIETPEQPTSTAETKSSSDPETTDTEATKPSTTPEDTQTEEEFDPDETIEDEHTETVGEGQGVGSL